MFARSVFALVAALALQMHCPALAQVSITERLALDQPPAVAASSNAKDTGYPEQSLAGFKWAIDRGVDIVVIGVQETADDRYIVLRDATLTRTTNVREVYPDGPPRRDSGDTAAAWHLVSDYTIDELQHIRLRDPREGDHLVPTLDETLDLIDGRMLAVLKLDMYDTDTLGALLEARATENLLLFTWSDQAKLRDFSLATGIGVWGTVENLDALPAFEKLLELYGSSLRIVDVEADQITSDLVARTTENGVRLSLVGPMQDMAISGGNPAPWLAAFDNPAGAYKTQYPDEIMQLVGR